MLLAFGAADTMAQKKKPVIRKKTTVRKTVRPAVKLYTVSTGTVFRVRMNNNISSKTARVGDRFTATVTEPVYSGTAQVVIPVGSTVSGRVDSVIPAKKGGNRGQIGVSFTSVRLTLPSVCLATR